MWRMCSYALGVPFRYGLAAALFALAAVLFADWDRSRSATGRRTPLMATTQPVRPSSRPFCVCGCSVKAQLTPRCNEVLKPTCLLTVDGVSYRLWKTKMTL